MEKQLGSSSWGPCWVRSPGAIAPWVTQPPSLGHFLCEMLNRKVSSIFITGYNCLVPLFVYSLLPVPSPVIYSLRTEALSVTFPAIYPAPQTAAGTSRHLTMDADWRGGPGTSFPDASLI